MTKPLAFTVMVGIAPPEPKVPTLELTVANVVSLLTEVISPVKFGILVVDDAVPVSAPTNVVAVITPETNTSPVIVSFDVGFVVPIPTLPLEGIKTKVELMPIEVLAPEETDENPINCGLVVLMGVDIVLLRIPVKLEPSPKYFVAVKIPTCTLVSVAIPGPSIFVNAILGF
jgi:hypothetical protein